MKNATKNNNFAKVIKLAAEIEGLRVELEKMEIELGMKEDST